MGLYDKPESFKPLHWFWIIGLGLLYAIYTALSWSLAYIDFGDGNYMYISWRIAQGAVVYRDILAPQPPCHLFLGAGLVKLGDLIGSLFGLGGEPFNTVYLYVFRSFSLLLHLANYALVLHLAWRAWGRPLTTVLAGAIWLWLPLNTWWAMGYQSEPLEIFFLLAMMACALRVTRLGDFGAGVFAALAGLTNATAAPFLLVLIVYMMLRAPLRALRMTAPCVLLVGAVVGALQFWTEGMFLQNAIFNQVGTFPGDTLQERIAYAIYKLHLQGQGVLFLEGGFVILALIGFWRYLSTSPLDTVSCGGLGWFCLATMGSLIYVAKGGTMDYIFSLAGPAVAILSAGELAAWVHRWRIPLPEVRSGWIVRTVPFWPAKIVAALLLAAFLLGPGLHYYGRLRDQSRFELTTEQTERVLHLVRKLSKPDDLILAPPHYAFMAHRRIWNDYSELYIWQMKYWKDRKSGNPQGQGWAEARRMAEALAESKVALVLLEMDQTGKFPEVMEALQAAYVPIESPLPRGGRPSFLLRTNNTQLGLFVPLADRSPQGLAEQRERWQAFKFDLLRSYGIDGVRLNFQWYDLPVAVGEPVAPAVPPAAPAKIKPILKAPAAAATQTTQTTQTAQPAPVTPTPTPRPTATPEPTATAEPHPVLPAATPPAGSRPARTPDELTTPGQLAPPRPVLPTPLGSPQATPARPPHAEDGATSPALPMSGPLDQTLVTSPTQQTVTPTPSPTPRRRRPRPEDTFFGRE